MKSKTAARKDVQALDGTQVWIQTATPVQQSCASLSTRYKYLSSCTEHISSDLTGHDRIHTRLL